ncbi:hypothetical protein [Rhodococcus sp. BE178]|uniref:hypothetical protein n=1 Tax=Rhodococcus sp. BE178 TaxID=2817737 RepID=UPI003D1CEAEB
MVLIEELPDEWSFEAENMAMFLDRFDFFLRSEYASWITDPDDPEVKAERALRKKRGIKPPQQPLIPPVAWRPGPIADLRRELYEAAVELHTPSVPDPGRKLGSRDFAALLAGG